MIIKLQIDWGEGKNRIKNVFLTLLLPPKHKDKYGTPRPQSLCFQNVRSVKIILTFLLSLKSDNSNFSAPFTFSSLICLLDYIDSLNNNKKM